MAESTADRLAEDDTVRDSARSTRPKGKAVIATDTRGRILYWNDAAEELYGWRREEVLNLNIVDVTPARMSRPEAAHIMKRLRDGESWSGAFEVRDRDGNRFRAAVTDSPVFNANGKLIGIIGVSARAAASAGRRRALRGSNAAAALVRVPFPENGLRLPAAHSSHAGAGRTAARSVAPAALA